MKLLEIKNNLVKISYTQDEPIALAKFIALVDENRSYVAQIINLKAETIANYAIAKLIFTFGDEGIIDNYDGSIPSLKANVSYISSKDILDLLPMEKPIVLGKLAQQPNTLKIDVSAFEKNLLICAEKFENIRTIINNFSTQLKNEQEKVVILDTDNNFDAENQLRFKKDFKLPLNSRMIDYIYENDLEEVDATSKAVIQDIFYEVQEYTKTVENNFLPFETFLSVVAEQYTQTNIPELALLKNKLLKYKEANVFAQDIEEITPLKHAVQNNLLTCINIADVSDSLQKELISYIHNVIDSTEEYTYLFTKITNNNSDKQLLKQLLDSEYVFTTITASHNYKYVNELKQHAENVIFFMPLTAKHDFASYNTLLNKLNQNEFIAYGNLTQNIPFIVELADLAEIEDISEPIAPIETEVNSIEYEEPQAVDEFEQFETPKNFDIIEEPQATEPSNEELVEQVAKDVDEIFYTKTEEIPPIENIIEEPEEVITEDDLDFIDELPSLDENEAVAESEPQEIIAQDEPTSGDDIFNEFSPEITEQESLDEIIEAPQQEENVDEISDEILTEEPEEFTLEEPEIELDEDKEQEIPVYPTEEPVEDETIAFNQGDTVSHPKYGKGVIEKLIKYGNKTLCSISFEEVGRRLLDPSISQLQKI